jgi:hypothetical protein
VPVRIEVRYIDNASFDFGDFTKIISPVFKPNLVNLCETLEAKAIKSLNVIELPSSSNKKFLSLSKLGLIKFKYKEFIISNYIS